ncbi:isoprenylcysteine carboxyl methyltransferase family protein [Calidifontibacillus oryziterrae]|uniref:isoprenylcysteine carboxyl methyltransferase family protein n=1 Tax=Calidifontibacillus oryziterrae TaxID=1191699 RepID=UPI0002EB7D96|nr:isoprenylcysteine carboxylmethyltransferase family protein [Calidifontibacillus oryziterrae]
MVFSVFISFIISQRLFELTIAKRNEKWMKFNGAIEAGKEHYKYMVLLHVLFFVCLIWEVTFFQKGISTLLVIYLFFFTIAQLLRVWSIMSLGRFWNTKIMILPNVNIISKGPYKYFRHPNYLVVVIELLVIPLMFNAYWTALVFSLLNIVMLTIRIRVEEQALMKETNYGTVFLRRSRFVPSKRI